ncbi:hypothetical protein RHMOL_Rhmol01G0232100 [Rhododendron molle]|uniref:Uncharacterized protein n=2 Tax=Rhododendron molle TaxID=49168 RepID=A0ACC0Q659_RHOML|nr:hypothetical protein RHMOL_Rhmol01G0232100 [Rhododendron molle]KAI8572849.1 hypothetical protein RHMOL_Rhmol01G0232100 [Rhododendron molle]
MSRARFGPKRRQTSPRSHSLPYFASVLSLLSNLHETTTICTAVLHQRRPRLCRPRHVRCPRLRRPHHVRRPRPRRLRLRRPIPPPHRPCLPAPLPPLAPAVRFIRYR